LQNEYHSAVFGPPCPSHLVIAAQITFLIRAGGYTHFVDPRTVEEIIESGDLGEELTCLLKEHKDQEDNG
jgi:hypothetical protein